ncbi:hypothetical protein ODS41_07195 [Pyrobaculum sp. 3827-6]|uniref:hypothetical protein n=1 Tax=Pyrobaculum sp. 3827-6 TaxID=2983604 RepID=UPI0021D9FAAB|nr:hypothetical protein [Pyrobaculum sp. 3827-6]MCU7787699.1 hypothetical protein [Pyrobaculum sp. 3827-6]
MDIAALIQLIADLLPFLHWPKAAAMYAYREGGDIVVCIDGAPRELNLMYIDVGGYHLPPSAAAGHGEVVHTGGEIVIPKRSHGALVIKGAPPAERVALVTQHGVYELKVAKEGYCPYVERRRGV